MQTRLCSSRIGPAILHLLFQKNQREDYKSSKGGRMRKKGMIADTEKSKRRLSAQWVLISVDSQEL